MTSECSLSVSASADPAVESITAFASGGSLARREARNSTDLALMGAWHRPTGIAPTQVSDVCRSKPVRSSIEPRNGTHESACGLVT
jgi:hypothetical protein